MLESNVDVTTDSFDENLLDDVTIDTPKLPTEKFRVAHNFKDRLGYIRRGKAGDIELSIAMFVKDEEDSIYESLNSIKGFALEYVIGIDKTTIDKTREIIEKFKSECPNHKFIIYEFEWEDNFSVHRNQAIERCTCPWILIMDGHDVFDTKGTATIIDVMTTMHDDVWIVEFLIFMSPDEYNIPSSFFPQPRLIRNRKEMRYESAVHNYIPNINAYNKIVVPDLIIFHKRSKRNAETRKEQRKGMGIEYFKQKVKENPNDTRSWFYLGNITKEDEVDLEKAAEYYESYLKCDVERFFIDEKGQVYINLCACYELLGKQEEMLNIAIKGLGEGLQRRELWMIMGSYYFNHKRFKEAIPYFLMATKLPMPMCQLFLSGPVYSYLPYEMLAECYIHLNNYEKAREAFLIMLDYMPRNPKIINNIRSCEAKLGIEEQVKPGINILIFDQFRSFTGNLAEKMAEENNVRILQKFSQRPISMADAIFQEWADQNAVLATESDYKIPIVLRIHRYEIFTETFKRINFKNVDAIIFTSKHVKKLALEMHDDLLEDLEKRNRIFIIPSSIHPESWPILDKFNSKKILFISSMRWIKNMQMIFELAAINPDLEFHHIGAPGMIDQAPFFEERNEKYKNVIFHGQIDRPKLNDKVQEISPGFICNLSLIEGCPYNVLEMMSKGLIPILYDYPGALEGLNLTNGHKFDTINEFRNVYNELFESGSDIKSRKDIRQHVIDNFNSDKHHKKVSNVVINLFDKYYVERSREIDNPFNKSLNLTNNLEAV